MPEHVYHIIYAIEYTRIQQAINKRLDALL